MSIKKVCLFPRRGSLAKVLNPNRTGGIGGEGEREGEGGEWRKVTALNTTF